MNKNEGEFLPGLDPKDEKSNLTDGIKRETTISEVKLTYATEDERIHCQVCEDVGPCRFCERGREEGSKIEHHQ